MNEKRCFRCKRTKPITEFYRNRSTKDGLQAMCKACSKEQTAKAIASGAFRRWMKTSVAKVRQNPEKLAHMRAKVNAWQRKKRGTDPEWREKKRLIARKHYHANKDVYVCRVSARKARLLGAGGSHSSEAWRQMLALFGNKCLCCGRTERITKDHIRPVTRGGTDDIGNLQPLCIWCNKSKFTVDKDYRTRDKVVLPELNAVGKLLFKGRVGQTEAAVLVKHKPASRCTGVYYAPKNANSVKVWRALIQVDGVKHDLGRHATKEEAIEAYNAAAKKYRGKHAFVND